MTGPWRCFHCDALIDSEVQARSHFGMPNTDAVPACVIAAHPDSQEQRRRLWIAERRTIELEAELAAQRVRLAQVMEADELKGRQLREVIRQRDALINKQGIGHWTEAELDEIEARAKKETE